MTEQPTDKIRVFLLDDHEIVRRGLTELLQSEGDIEVVGESGLAREAARRIPALRPDVAVLDGRLPDGSGIDVCREVRSQHPEIAALILTSYDDDDALFAAIMAGAAGYILKQVRGNDLLDPGRPGRARPSPPGPPGTAPGRPRPVDAGPVGHGPGARTRADRAAPGQGARGADRAGAEDPGADRRGD